MRRLFSSYPITAVPTLYGSQIPSKEGYKTSRLLPILKRTRSYPWACKGREGMSKRETVRPAVAWRVGIAFFLLLMGSLVRADAATHHRRSVSNARHQAHARPARQKEARKAHGTTTTTAGAALPLRRPRWHPGVDLALRLSGQRVPRR